MALALKPEVLHDVHHVNIHNSFYFHCNFFVTFCSVFFPNLKTGLPH